MLIVSRIYFYMLLYVIHIALCSILLVFLFNLIQDHTLLWVTCVCRRGAVMVKDSNFNDWLYVIKSVSFTRNICTGHLHWSSALVICTYHLHWSSALVICTYHLNWSSALVICTGHLHWLQSLCHWKVQGSLILDLKF